MKFPHLRPLAELWHFEFHWSALWKTTKNKYATKHLKNFLGISLKHLENNNKNSWPKRKRVYIHVRTCKQHVRLYASRILLHFCVSLTNCAFATTARARARARRGHSLEKAYPLQSLCAQTRTRGTQIHDCLNTGIGSVFRWLQPQALCRQRSAQNFN